MAESSPAEQALEEGRAPGAVSARAQRHRITDRQGRFIEYRANGHKPKESALLAGVPPSMAAQLALKWEADERIAKAIADAQAMHGAEAKVGPADVIRELALIAFSTLDDYVVIDDDDMPIAPAEDAPPSVMRAVSSAKRKVKYEMHGEESVPIVTVEFRLWDKIAALRMLGDYLGMWIKRVRVEEDGEMKATLQAMRRTMQRVEARARLHEAEEQRVEAFRTEAELARAGAVVASSPRPLDALRALAQTVDAAIESLPNEPRGGSDADA